MFFSAPLGFIALCALTIVHSFYCSSFYFTKECLLKVTVIVQGLHLCKHFQTNYCILFFFLKFHFWIWDCSCACLPAVLEECVTSTHDSVFLFICFFLFFFSFFLRANWHIEYLRACCVNFSTAVSVASHLKMTHYRNCSHDPVDFFILCVLILWISTLT